MRLKLVSCESTRNSAGKKYVNEEFHFPRKVKKFERCKLWFISDVYYGKCLYLSEVHEYHFMGECFIILTKNSEYVFKVICD